MTDSTASPHPAAGKTLAEHRALHALLEEVERAASDPAAVAAGEGLTARLDALRERLAAHFAGEEREGLFEQIQELAPGQGHECAQLYEEHRTMLRELDALRSASAEARAPEDWAARTRAFLDLLAGHENRENEILTRALDGAEAAQD